MTDLIVDHKPRRRKWTDVALHLEAQKYQTKGEFRKKSPSAYNAARKSIKFDDYCRYMLPVRKHWTDEALRQEAVKYKTKRDFMRGSNVAYQTIQKSGRIDKFCAHMKPVRIQWTNDLLHAEALRFSTRTEFARKHTTAYNLALRRGILDQICRHMSEAFGVDAVYLWKIKGTDIYKIGITASVYGLCRMYQVAETGGFDPEIVIQTTVKCRPHQVERRVLSLGQPVTFDQKFPGYTEFRRLNDNEVAQAVGIIASNSWLN